MENSWILSVSSKNWLCIRPLVWGELSSFGWFAYDFLLSIIFYISGFFRRIYYDLADYGVHNVESETQPDQKYYIYLLIFIWPENEITFLSFAM